MKKLILLIWFTVLFLALTVNTASALRYGNELISIGDLKHEVSLVIGEPLSRETIGYIDHVESEKRIRVMKIEEWIYSSSFYGEKSFYRLVFEGNELVEIRKEKIK